jgi:hypothetical protein
LRRYDDLVEVRRGLVPGVGGRVEGPAQFLWRGRLWKVSGVVSHWVETGAWWQSRAARSVLGAEQPEHPGQPEQPDQPGQPGQPGHPWHPGHPGQPGGPALAPDLLAEREVWRVEAGHGRATGRGVFDLVFDWAAGSWRLTGCSD